MEGWPKIETEMSTFNIQDLGLLEYGQAWDLQRQTHREVANGRTPTLLLVEHPAVVTLGRKPGSEGHILASPEFLSNLGIGVHHIERGGDVTFHGEGQLVGYPIFPVGRKVRDFLRKLENVLISTLAAYGLQAHGNEGYAGVYVGEEKIASLGIAIKNHVSLHGFALNVNTRLEYFDYIVPCGLGGVRMTSLERLLGAPQSMEDVKAHICTYFQLEFAHYDWSVPKTLALPEQQG